MLPTGIAVAQPDLSHAGGITEVRADRRAGRDLRRALAPHCPLGPIALAASLQVAFCHAELPHPGAEPRHPLQQGRRPARLPGRHRALPVHRRARARRTALPGLGVERRRGRGARRRPRRARLAQPGLAPPRRLLRRMVSAAASPHADAPALRVVTDPARGGRWTSLAAGGREWLWRRDEPRRASRVPGDPFADAGGLEECVPTVRGRPDHGDAWTRRWYPEPDPDPDLDPADGVGPGRATRRAAVHRGVPGLPARPHDPDAGTAAVADYRLTAAPGYRFLWAAHALLDLSARARLAVEEGAPGRLYADGGARWILRSPGRRRRASRSTGSGRTTARRSARSSTPREATVYDGPHTLTFALRPRASRCRSPLWRNLRGFPDAARRTARSASSRCSAGSSTWRRRGSRTRRASRRRGEAAGGSPSPPGGPDRAGPTTLRTPRARTRPTRGHVPAATYPLTRTRDPYTRDPRTRERKPARGPADRAAHPPPGRDRARRRPRGGAARAVLALAEEGVALVEVSLSGGARSTSSPPPAPPSAPARRSARARCSPPRRPAPPTAPAPTSP